jgi:four helix bundle protein
MKPQQDGDNDPEPLDQRTERFAQSVRAFIPGLPRTVCNVEDVKQLVRSSGSAAASLIEASEAISKKDCLLRLKYCRKEAKESRLWLSLVHIDGKEALETQRTKLVQEANELKLIFAAILRKHGE